MLSTEKESKKKQLQWMKKEIEVLHRQEQRQSDSKLVALKYIIAIKESKVRELQQEVSRIDKEMSQATETQLMVSSKHIEELNQEREQVRQELENEEMVLYVLRQREQDEKNN